MGQNVKNHGILARKLDKMKNKFVKQQTALAHSSRNVVKSGSREIARYLKIFGFLEKYYNFYGVGFWYVDLGVRDRGDIGVFNHLY